MNFRICNISSSYKKSILDKYKFSNTAILSDISLTYLKQVYRPYKVVYFATKAEHNTIQVKIKNKNY